MTQTTKESEYQGLIDKLTRRTTQLSALLSTTFGNEFQAYSSDIQSNYLWACSDIADEIAQIAEKLDSGEVKANND